MKMLGGISVCGGVRIGLLLALATGSAACGIEPDTSGQGSGSDVSTERSALSGPTVTISGTVADSQVAQAGVTITLSGSAQGKVITDFSGAFSFTVASGGSYSLTAAGTPNFFQPPFTSCLSFSPNIVNLNNLTTNTVVNILGAGTDVVTNCAPAEIMGATSGAFTISGVVSSAGCRYPARWSPSTAARKRRASPTRQAATASPSIEARTRSRSPAPVGHSRRTW